MESEQFAEVVALHKDRIHSYACMMLRDAEEARDVAQETLVRLWQHREAVEQSGERAWLLRTAHNLCIDRIRRRRTRVDLDDEEAGAELCDLRPAPDRLAGATETRRLLEEALDALLPIDRAVLVMREVQELPYDEIAVALGLPLGTLKARLHRARERLRRRLVGAGVRP